MSESSPSVAILLCTKDGSRFLSEQLDSLLTQIHKNIRIFVSDDGSEDDTCSQLEKYRSKLGDDAFEVRLGPRKGYAANFMSLICSETIDADYFALSDQDDVWDKDKISRAIVMLQKIPQETPALYCARTRTIDDIGREVGLSPLFKKKPSFANSIVQNICAGNTMVMNKAARKKLQSAGQLPIVSHDWWIYMLITGVGGIIIYDRKPTLGYRQHDRNLIGSSTGIRASLTRTRMNFLGHFREWNNVNTSALQNSKILLTVENRKILEAFCKARKSKFLTRIIGVWRSGVYRQTFKGNLNLIAGTIFNKL